MAIVAERPVWESSIRLIDPNDPVQGGSGGIDNIPHEQLANRTAYLKQEIAEMKGDTTEAVTLETLLQRIKVLEDAPAITVPVLPIGATFETTVVYTSGQEVSAAMGYGTWQPFAEGRTTIGVSSKIDDPDWTKTIGTKYGEYEHTLTIDEIPEHKHSKSNLYNKFMAKGQDVLTSPDHGSYISSNSTGLTGVNFDNTAATNEHQTGGMTVKGWTDSTEQAIGGGQPHNNVQPSIVVGKWVRTA